MAVVEKLFVSADMLLWFCCGSQTARIRTSANLHFYPPAAQARNAAPAALNAAAIQARTYAADAKASPTEVSSILEQRIRGVQDEANLAETGRVLSVGYVRTSCQRRGDASSGCHRIDGHYLSSSQREFQRLTCM